MTSNSLAEQILTYRRLHGLTQKKLAHLLGIDPTTIGHWERGEHWPQKELLNKLISFFTSFPLSASDHEKNEKME
jgi:transcriptional regulator with XRE-family HTH domain